jgi:hypothetical protein
MFAPGTLLSKVLGASSFCQLAGFQPPKKTNQNLWSLALALIFNLLTPWGKRVCDKVISV